MADDSVAKVFRVYYLLNTVTQQGYIGFTGKSVEHRFRGHCRAAADGAKLRLSRAIRKYGVEAFEIREIATVATRAEATALERHFISLYATRSPKGYNLTDGGEGALGRKMTPAQIEFLRLKATGFNYTPEMRENMARGQRGRKHPDHVKAKMIVSAKAAGTGLHERSESEKERLRNLAKGRKRSPEFKEALRQAQTGKAKSPEHREALRLAALARHAKLRAEGKTITPPRQKGIPRTPETVERMRAAWVLRRAREQAETSIAPAEAGLGSNL